MYYRARHEMHLWIFKGIFLTSIQAEELFSLTASRVWKMTNTTKTIGVISCRHDALKS